MIEAYRITKEPNPAKAFSGQGAKDWGGRWNSRGVEVVYTAAHRSLAILEVLVHVKGGAGIASASISTPFYVYIVSFDAALMEELPISSLPDGWNSEPPTSFARSILGCSKPSVVASNHQAKGINFGEAISCDKMNEHQSRFLTTNSGLRRIPPEAS